MSKKYFLVVGPRCTGKTTFVEKKYPKDTYTIYDEVYDEKKIGTIIDNDKGNKDIVFVTQCEKRIKPSVMKIGRAWTHDF